MVDLSRYQATLGRKLDRLLSYSNVVATGIGYKQIRGVPTDRLSLICSVQRKLPLSQLAPRDRIPALVEELPTDVIETGTIRALQERTGRQRPALGGTSVGHRDITAGTLGCIVEKGGSLFILSNNHVLANSNSGIAGDPILQPGPIDGGQLPQDQIAELSAFVPIHFQEIPSDCGFARAVIALLNAGCRFIGSETRYRITRSQQGDNLVDAAIAQVRDPDLVSREILGIGRIQGVARAILGAAIQKSGRTTGFTKGEIEQVNVTVNVQYGEGRIARFSDQLLAGAMSRGGDSGSVVLNADKRLVGLLFAGSDNTTIINRIEHVFSAFDVGL